MLKIFICLLIVSQIYCQDNGKKFRDDEIDIKTDQKSTDNYKPEIKTDKTPETQLEPRDEKTVKTDTKSTENDEQFGESVPGTKDDQGKYPKQTPGFDSNTDLGKEYKKPETNIKDHNKNYGVENKNNEQDKDKIPADYEDIEAKDKNVKKDEGFGGFDDKNFGGTDERNKVGVGSDEKNRNSVKYGNELMDNLLNSMKKDYRSEFEKVVVADVGPIKNGRWGTIKLHSGVVTGLQNAERHGDVIIFINEHNQKSIKANIAVNDVYANYKVDAKLFNRISIKDRELKLSLKRALVYVVLDVKPNEKKLVIRDVTLKSTEGFAVKSGRLFWPFNKLTDAIVKRQEPVIKDIIKTEISKYMGKVVENVKLDDLLAKL